ncbi:MAG TPA: choice-of-anchor P family protein [Actinomycetota bacterium]|nr:choice-of-anchor P family protein [Actinomycetota bacterium]
MPANCTNFAVTSTLSCQVTVPAGQTVNIVYQAQMPTTFSGTGGQPPCTITGEFPVVNHVTITGGGNAQATVCVIANPSLSLHKSASSINAVGGQTLVFSLNYVNGGPGSAQNVVVTDPLPSSLTFGSCSNNCVNVGQSVTWTVGTVPAGTNATLTVTTTVNSNVGCSVCNQASMTSPSQNNGAPILSNNLCLVGVPGPNPAGAHARGNAVGLNVNVSALLGLLAVRATLSQASSSQTGVGSNGNHQQVATVNLNLGGLGGVLNAGLLSTQSNAVITASPAEAKDTSVAETANLNILNGLVKADVIRAVAATDANGSSSSFDAAGSGIAGLVINGVAYGTVTQTLTVGLPALVFGPNSYVSVLQQVGSTSGPATGQNSGGTYAADLQVTGIHVHISGILAVIASADIVVSQATAHSDFPQTTICATSPTQAVSGHAFILSEQTDPSLLPILLGLSAIPSSGGHAHSDLLNANALGVAIAGTLNTDALGTITPTQSQSVDSANVANVCVIPTGVNTCAIQAKAITSKSSSTANASGASSNDTGTQFVNLKVLGVNISAQVLPNTFINLPGIGAVVLNEQFCDNGGLTFTHTCTGTHHSGLTVRAIDVVVDNFQNGGILPIGAQIIVAEAHSDATFGP